MAEQQTMAKAAGSIIPPAVRSRPARQKKIKATRGSSKAGWFTGFLSGLVFCLLAAAVLAGLIWLNIGDLRTTIVTTLKLSATEHAYLETRNSELTQAEVALAAQGKQLDSSQAVVDKQQKELDKKTAELDTRESELKAMAAKLSEQQVGLKAVISLYEAMDPGKAAQILTAAENLDAQMPILKNMNKSSLALILAEMTPTQASKIVTLIAGNLAANP